jgi:hypothetical protein
MKITIKNAPPALLSYLLKEGIAFTASTAHAPPYYSPQGKNEVEYKRKFGAALRFTKEQVTQLKTVPLDKRNEATSKLRERVACACIKAGMTNKQLHGILASK